MIAMFRMSSGSTAIAVPSSVEDVDSIRRARALPRAVAPSGPCMASLLLHLIEAEERKARRQAPENIMVSLHCSPLLHAAPKKKNAAKLGGYVRTWPHAIRVHTLVVYPPLAIAQDDSRHVRERSGDLTTAVA